MDQGRELRLGFEEGACGLELLLVSNVDAEEEVETSSREECATGEGETTEGSIEVIGMVDDVLEDFHGEGRHQIGGDGVELGDSRRRH